LAQLAAAALVGVSAIPSAHAVITVGPRQFVSTSDYMAGGRAQYIGLWGAETGTPIGPRHFITAYHVGDAGGAGSFTYYNGTATATNYHATFAARQDDLAIWVLTPDSPSFTRWAPLFSASNETGQALMVIGRGTDKGAEVHVPDVTGELRGWRWGTPDGAVTWGTNTVTEVWAFDPPAPEGLGGDYLYFEFNQGQGDSECIYSSGDSGGAVFITDPADGIVKLAGINSLVDGNFSYTAAGPYFPAGIWDVRGMYYGVEGNYEFIPPDYATPVVPGSYATRISSRMTFIRSIIGNPSTCGSADFNGDGDSGTDADIEAFFACIAGSCCATCGSADFNGDGDTGTDADIEAFFRVLAGGTC
jgi:hypothetical protein